MRRQPQRPPLRSWFPARPAGLAALDWIHRAARCDYKGRPVASSASASGMPQPQAPYKEIAELVVADLQVCGWEEGGGGAPALRWRGGPCYGASLELHGPEGKRSEAPLPTVLVCR